MYSNLVRKDLKDIHGTLSDFLRKTEMETAEKCDVMIKYGDVKK